MGRGRRVSDQWRVSALGARRSTRTRAGLVRSALFIRAVAVGSMISTGALAAAGQSRTDLESADSVVLERTACFGTCPIYVLRLAKDGSVWLRALDRNGAAHVSTWKVASRVFADLMTSASMY